MIEMNNSVRNLGKKILASALSLGRGRECPICHWTGIQFLPVTHPRASHLDATCPSCGSAERTRFAYMFMKDKLSDVQRMLHFAPEMCLKDWLVSNIPEYLTADIDPAKADYVEDIQQITFEDDSFDLVWCSHVLEHVPDDRRAMRELRRITKPFGHVIIQVPLWHNVTDEDLIDINTIDRTQRFYQHDHLRLYGYDIEDRLKESGFQVEVIRPHYFPPEVVFKYALCQPGNYEIFFCTKNQ